MSESESELEKRIAERVVGLYGLLHEDDLPREDLNLYELTDPEEEAEVYLPHIGINFELWTDWSTEKRVEVLVHEFAHAENYDDDHEPSFWDRVADLTDRAVEHRHAVETLFDDDLDPDRLKLTVVESIHEGVIECDVDSVRERRRAVARTLGVADERTGSD